MSPLRLAILLKHAGAMVLIMLLCVTAAHAQSSAARIDGVVSDPSGLPMPGVTVTLTSPALQVAQLSAVTDGNGEYRFIDLRPGSYRLQYELDGFQTAIREEIELTAGFAARVNMVMTIGSLNETVVVKGESPIVDVSTTSGGQLIETSKLVEELPGNKTVADIVSLSPGMVNQAGQNPGALSLAGRPRFEDYGLSSDNTNTTIMIDGLPVIVNNPLPDVGTTQQVDVRTFGNGPEVKEPGAFMNLVLKSGSDEFHGSLSESFMKQPSGNIDDALRARNFTVAGQLDYFNDTSADLGGRLIRKQLWFYGAYRYRFNRTSQPGLVLNAGPDGKYKTGDEPAAWPKYTGRNMTGRVSYQMSPAYSLVGLIIRDRTWSGAEGRDYANTPYDSTATLLWMPRHEKLEFKAIPSSKIFIDVLGGHSGWGGGGQGYDPQEATRYVPTATDRTTLMNSGAASDRRSGKYKFYTINAQATMLPEGNFGGKHEFKIGYYFGRYSSTYFVPSREYGNYTLIFDNSVPFQFVALNSPVDPTDWDDASAVFAGDHWMIGQRVTLNLGLRWDWQHSWMPTQSRVDGQWPFTPAATFDPLDVMRYSHVAPRVAVAYDVTGNGRTVVKASYGWFNPLVPMADSFNANTSYSNTYLWHDLNRNNNYDPGEVNLSLTGSDFVSTTNPKFSLLNPALKLASVHEIAGSIERQLAATMSIRGLYLRRINDNRSTSVSLLRPSEIYNNAYTRKDPGPDGVVGTADDGGMVTLYDYDAKYRSATFTQNQTQNAPSSVPHDYVQVLEAAFTQRQNTFWSMTLSFSANNTRTNVWAQNPNQANFFPTNNIWTWNSKMNGNVNLPHDIAVGGILEFLSGVQGQRTYIFRAADPLGGPAFKGQTTITVPLEPAGSHKEPAYALVNARVSKAIRLGGQQRIRLSLDVLNLFNANAPLAVSFASGPTFNNVTSAVTPRDFRVNMTYQF